MNEEYLFTACSGSGKKLEKAFYGNKCLSRKKNISRCSWWNWLYVNEPMKSRIWERSFRVAISKWIAWELAAWWIKSLGTASLHVFDEYFILNTWEFYEPTVAFSWAKNIKANLFFSAFTTSWVERSAEDWNNSNRMLNEMRKHFLVGIKQKCSLNAWILSFASEKHVFELFLLIEAWTKFGTRKNGD